MMSIKDKRFVSIYKFFFRMKKSVNSYVTEFMKIFLLKTKNKKNFFGLN